MDPYSFVLTFVAIILGVAATKAMEAIGQSFKHHTSDHYYLPHILVSLLTVLLIIQFWWAVFDERELLEWNFLSFLLLLITPLLYYFMAELLNAPDATTDIRDHYWQQIRYVCLIAAAIQISNMLFDMMFMPDSVSLDEHLIRIAVASLLIVIAHLHKEWQHYAAYGIFYSALAGYTLLYTFQI